MPGVSTQIAVRLPDEVVEYLDAQVRSGRAKSRAELITRLIGREQRRDRSVADLDRITAAGHHDDLEASVATARRTPLGID